MSFQRSLFGFMIIIFVVIGSFGARGQFTTLAFQPGTLTGGSRLEPVWHESGFTLQGNPKFASTSHGIGPSNGTDYLQLLRYQAGAILTNDNGDVFTPISIDLAEYSSVTIGGGYQPEFITFQGLTESGSFVYNEFQLDLYLDGTGGLDDFQTFYFDSQFTNVVEVTLVDELFSLDNLVVYIPTSGTMIPVAIAGFISMQRKRYL